MPVNRSRKLSRGKTVHWDSNVDLRSPDTKKAQEYKENSEQDLDFGTGISVVGVKKQIKTSGDKNVDKKNLANKNKNAKKKNIPNQWQAKPVEFRAKEEPKIFEKITKISPRAVLVPSRQEDSDSDISLSRDLENLLKSSPKGKHVNKRIIKDLEVLNSFTFKKNPQDLTSSHSVGDLSFRKSPRQTVKSSLSFNDLRTSGNFQKDYSPRSGKSTGFFHRSSKDTNARRVLDAHEWRQEVYARDRHTFIRSDDVTDPVGSIRGSHQIWDDDLSSQTLDSIPSPTDLLFNRGTFLLSPDHKSEQISSSVAQRKPEKVENTPKAKGYKLTTRSTVVSQAEERITSDRPDPSAVKPISEVKASRDLIDYGLLKVGKSPTEPEVATPPTPVIEHSPRFERYGSGDLKSPENKFDSPTEELSDLQSHDKTGENQNPLIQIPQALADPEVHNNLKSPSLKSPGPTTIVPDAPKSPAVASPAADINSAQPNPDQLHPNLSSNIESPWGSPRQVPQTNKEVLSLKRLAFNKLKTQYEDEDTPRVIPSTYNRETFPGSSSTINLERDPAPSTSNQTFSAGPEFANFFPQNQESNPFVAGLFNQPFVIPGHRLSFPPIPGFPYPDLVYPQENLSSDPIEVPADNESVPIQRFIFIGNPEEGTEPLNIPTEILTHLKKSDGPVITELDSSLENKSIEESKKSKKSKKPKSSNSSKSSGSGKSSGSAKSSGSSGSSSSSSGTSDSSSSSSSSSSGSGTSRSERQSDAPNQLEVGAHAQEVASDSARSPTQFLKNIKKVSKKKKEKEKKEEISSNSEMDSTQSPHRKQGVVESKPYYKPTGTQYIMKSKTNSRETSAGTSKSANSRSNHITDPARREYIQRTLETIESARDPSNFNPISVPDFTDSDIEEAYEGKDLYVLYLQTDDGELIGPLRLDIEDIQMGLPGMHTEGMRNRQTGSHGLNEFSSRSHSMLTVTIDSELPDQEDDNLYITKRGKLTFVDLAGSEKVRDTNSSGGTLTEANSINKSLLILGNCISHLGDSKRRQGHIPYRDSKLTKLLADSLGGNGVTLMIACVTPSSHNSNETLNTLRYASRAKKIKTKPVVKMDPREKLILSLKREIKVLRNENHYLRQQLDFPAKPKGQLQKENDEKFMTFMKEQQRKESGLYEMLQEYMVENEALRSENSDHHSTRDKIRREQQGLYRENEKLMKRIEELERIVATSPQTWQQISRNASQVENVDDRYSPRLHGKAHVTPGQQYPVGGDGQAPARTIPTRLPPQDLPRPDPNQLGNIPTNRTRPPPPPGGVGHPTRPPHRLPESINRYPQGSNGDPVAGPSQNNPQSSPRVKHRQGSPNRPVDRRVSQGSNSDAIHGMNAKLKSELAELENEIAQHHRYAHRRPDHTYYPYT